MSATASNQPFVDDLVETLTGPVEGELNAADTLREQMKRATQEFDERTAHSAARALLGELCQDSSDIRRLEALLIMGLSHPSVLEKHRISLATEGRRLAVLLERAEQAERARCLLEHLSSKIPSDSAIDHDLAGIMRRTGSTDALVERHLRRADDAAQRGKTMEAISWLQEVVLLDRNRRDVARMIRDLRYQEKERRVKNARRVKLTVLAIVGSVLLGGAVLRESKVAGDFQSVPLASEGDVASMRARLASLEGLIESNRVWLGLWPAIGECDRLRTEIEKLETVAAREKRVKELEIQATLELAESMRLSGAQHAQQGKFDLALADFRKSLQMATPTWEHRSRVQADVDAIEAWQRGSK